jgi:WD40 repeat protein
MMKRTNKYRTMLTALLGTLLFTTTLVTLAQTERVGIIAVASGGDYYAAAYADRTIRIWDATTQQILATIVYTDQLDIRDQVVYRIVDLEFSPNGTLLAASFGGGAVRQGSVRVFDASTGTLVTELDGWSSAGDIAWSPDGTRLAARASYGAYTRYTEHIMVWDIPSGDLVMDQDLGENASGINISWSPDGSQLATADGSSLYLSDTATWSREPNITFPAGVTDITWSPNGSQIAGVDVQGAVYIADASTSQIIRTLPGTSAGEYIRKLAWNANNQIAVTNTDQILVWDATTGNLLATVPVSDAGAVAWLTENRLLYAGSDTRTEPEIVDLSAIVPTQTPTAVPH